MWSTGKQHVQWLVFFKHMKGRHKRVPTVFKTASWIHRFLSKIHSHSIKSSMGIRSWCLLMEKVLRGGQTTMSNTEIPQSHLWEMLSIVSKNQVKFPSLWFLICADLQLFFLFFSDTVKPLFWSRPVYELDPNNSANNGFMNQDFLVWMRRAALPDFRKLYRRITEGDYSEGLPAGNYSIEISYSILFALYIKIIDSIKLKKTGWEITFIHFKHLILNLLLA